MVVELQDKMDWVFDNISYGDHIGVKTAGFLFWGEYLDFRSKRGDQVLTMQLDTGETIMLLLDDILDINMAWPQ